MSFPYVRLRRLRQNNLLREMVQETELSVKDLIYPLFVVEGKGVKKEVPSMPGVYNLSIDEMIKELREVEDLGIPAIILFGIPEEKDEKGSSAYDPQGIIQKAVKEIKKEKLNLIVITDVCLCEYTSHGHCGILKEGRYGIEVDNDQTLEVLAKEALSHVEAGADMVAPSDMMDGRVLAIREMLDENGFNSIPIMAYSAKFASGFYGPFREAAQSAPSFGDRKGYQMDPANGNEALREVELDIMEGADIVMVKPALSYMDIIWRVKQRFEVPVACYNVSGEYSMVKAASKLGYIDEKRIVLEMLLSMKRAGADLILTYFAKDVAKYLKG
ncbi:MAG: porphobilinogen synthase [Thermoanaerobaculia bacterium]